MPDYRKKRRNKMFSAPQRVKKSRINKKEDTQDIKMSPSKKRNSADTSKSNMRVITGKKLEQKRKFKVFAVALAVLLAAVLIFQIIFPAGILTTLSNSIALIGTGGYPISLDSTDTINTVSEGSHYYVLSDSRINAFSNSGKELFSYAHGYENPVLKTSAAGALVFEQGAKVFALFDLNGLEEEITVENEIITAAISDSGAYAIVTRSEKYASAVSVYSKGGKKVYEWYSAKDTVNSAALSQSGKKLAVATFNSSVGQYESELRILGFDSATPLYSQKVDDSLIYSLENSHNSSFAVVTKNSVEFIKWSNYKIKEYSNDYTTSFFKVGKGGSTVVFNRESDKTDNRVLVFSRSGKKLYEFDFKGIISDITVYGGHIYCMSDTDIYILDENGGILRRAVCGFGAVNINVTATNTVAVVTDNKIEKIKLEQE